VSFLPAKVTARTEWAPGLVTLTLGAAAFDFEPGQFVSLADPKRGAASKRAYSLASAPGAPPEFFLNRVPGGALSPTLVDTAVGESVLLQSVPSGFFTLGEVPEHTRDLWLIATGTGLGPYISMLRSAALFARFEHVVLVHGARLASELAYAAEISALKQARPGQFEYVPATSQDAPGPGPGGTILSGRITAHLASGRLEERAGLSVSAEHGHVLLCGNPGMIQEVTSLLGERGLRRHRRRTPGHISTEKYW
jgi:ferredoxin--NADP+ reductase